MRYRVAALFLPALAACSTTPTLLVTNGTGRPLEVYAYDYSVSNSPMRLPGIYIGTPNPRFTIGRVSSPSACLAIGTPSVSDMFVLTAEDTLTGAQTPATGTFVPQDAPGWNVTFDTLAARPIGPVATAACTP